MLFSIVIHFLLGSILMVFIGYIHWGQNLCHLKLHKYEYGQTVRLKYTEKVSIKLFSKFTGIENHATLIIFDFRLMLSIS